MNVFASLNVPHIRNSKLAPGSFKLTRHSSKGRLLFNIKVKELVM